MLKEHQLAFVHDCETQRLLSSLPCRSDVEAPVASDAVAMHLQANALGLHVRDRLGHRSDRSRTPLLRTGKVGGGSKHRFVLRALLWREGEGAATSVLGSHAEEFVALIILRFFTFHSFIFHLKAQRSIAYLTLAGRRLKGDATRHSGHEVATLGEQREA